MSPSSSGPNPASPLPRRASKLVSGSEALASLRDGQMLMIGGTMFHSKPMHLVREVVRLGLRDLVVVAFPQASIDIDMLIGAGCVREVRTPYIGFDHLGLAPCHRRIPRNGAVKIWHCGEAIMVAALEAAARGLPSGMTKGGVGTDLPNLNRDLRVTSDPVTGEPMIAVPAIRPDLTIIHASAGDMYGNLFHSGYAFADLILVEATKQAGGRVVASVDELVPPTRASAMPFRTSIAHPFVDAVVDAPFGAHPCSSHGVYGYDEEALTDYLRAAADGERLARYLDTFVHASPANADYLDLFRPSRLLALRKHIYV